MLRESGGLADTVAGWRNYIGYLGLMAENDGPRRETKFGQLSRGWAIGSAAFKADLAKELAGHEGRDVPFELLGADREAHKQARAEIWEKKLRCGAAALGISLERLPPTKSAPEKVRLAALLKGATSVSKR